MKQSINDWIELELELERYEIESML